MPQYSFCMQWRHCSTLCVAWGSSTDGGSLGLALAVHATCANVAAASRRCASTRRRCGVGWRRVGGWRRPPSTPRTWASPRRCAGSPARSACRCAASSPWPVAARPVATPEHRGYDARVGRLSWGASGADLCRGQSDLVCRHRDQGVAPLTGQGAAQARGAGGHRTGRPTALALLAAAAAVAEQSARQPFRTCSSCRLSCLEILCANGSNSLATSATMKV